MLVLATDKPCWNLSDLKHFHVCFKSRQPWGWGGPRLMLCHLQTIVSMVPGVSRWLGGFNASSLGWGLVTKARREMVERRRLLDGRWTWGVWDLACIEGKRGLRTGRQDLWSLGQNRQAPLLVSRDRAWERGRAEGPRTGSQWREMPGR